MQGAEDRGVRRISHTPQRRAIEGNTAGDILMVGQGRGENIVGHIRVRLIIEGRVQGVWFRDSTRTEARRLGVKGWVKNLPDGNVEALAEGPEDKVEALIKYCHNGPPYAKVTNVKEMREEWLGEFNSFDIVF